MQRNLSSFAAKEKYYGMQSSSNKTYLKEKYEIIMEALKKSKIVLESAAFIKMVREDV